MKKIAVVILIFFCFSAVLSLNIKADTYWVSPEGEAAWEDARGNTPLSGAEATTLATANSNARAGDTIILRDGTYNTSIQPINSGTGKNSRIVYKAHEGETPVISGTDQWNSFFGILLNNQKSYIKVTGITVRDVDRWLGILRGSTHNEISYCRFEPPVRVTYLNIYSGGTQQGDLPSTHNWFHNNVAYGGGYVSDDWNDVGGVMYIGSIYVDGHSGYNTIENNTLYHGSHHVLEVWTPYNIIRNNIIHNDSWMDPPANPIGPPLQEPATNGKYGNRCVTLTDQTRWNREGTYNLLENNRLGHAGRPPDDMGAENLELASYKNIVRYNYLYNAANRGIYFRAEEADMVGSDNRVYNNTVYYSGQNESHGYGINNTHLNGIFYRTSPTNTGHYATLNVIKNNISFAGKNRDILGWWPDEPSGNKIENNWVTTDGDPRFINPDITDPANFNLPDLSLLIDSPVIDRGVHLTTAVSAGNRSITLYVQDALYFQDGSWGSPLSDVKADWIAIGTVDNTVEISSIDYSADTITLTSPMDWNVDDPIWLYKDSAGRIVLHGSAPDIGAYEYERVTHVGERENISDDFFLFQNYPNPFNPETSINFSLPLSGEVTLRIYDIMGREIITLVKESKPAGRHTVNWDGRNAGGRMVGSGVYFYNLRSSGGYHSVKKMVKMN